MLTGWIIFIVIYIGIGICLMPHTVRLLSQHGVTAENYKHDLIPIGMGLFLWMMTVIYIVLLTLSIDLGWLVFMKPSFRIELLYEYIIGLSVITFIGWLDDTIGDKAVKGFEGHWKKWRDEKVVTTGLLKVGITFTMASWLVVETYDTVWAAAIRFSFIILMTNALNLFDLRPGRTLKVFFMLSLVPVFFGTVFRCVEFLLPIVISAYFLFQKDLKGKLMLGDTGSNYLGFALGFCLSVSTPIWFQIFMLIALILLHWLAAKNSITKVIEHHPILHWLDQWGRT